MSSPTITAADTVQQDDRLSSEASARALDVLYSPDPNCDGQHYRLPRATFTIGRRATGDHHLSLDDPAVSKLHAEITWSPVRQRHLLGDLKSRNGTHLNGVRIDRELLGAGDLVRIGDSVLRFTAFAGDPTGWSPPEGCLLVGRSRSLQRTLERIDRAAPSAITVLLSGETGTGKDLLARTLHQQSGRSGPLAVLNCAAIPHELVESELFGHVKGAFSGAEVAQPGLFRAAEGGTLFLDEVGELAQEIQAKLLRAIETKQIRPVGAAVEQSVDVRIIAATNRVLEDEVAAGRFRPDLYARLAGWQIEVAPLRERPEDLAPLWRHFVAREGAGHDYQMKGVVFEALARHDWPYNVRELAAWVRNLILGKPEGGRLELADLPAALRPQDQATRPVLVTRPPEGEAPTAGELRRLVEEFHGNIKEVASFLGKDRTQVYRWLKRYGIDPGGYR